ncbi:hypothetical protein ABF87_02980 [Nitrosomonas sp. JL21]|uniref:hypothetical protein n=1 Tax=Nitrosomonas sp. JL21 TaxID=153949 RepID=UPI001369A507|nr:hypothetical protein [Nitrosomonas sp. JL21]MBL8496297.1 hypothetical protein [Nitrosomonas sp.]MXS76936.1 hypothetical protein [Nitrosomonas sp. JL21]
MKDTQTDSNTSLADASSSSLASADMSTMDACIEHAKEIKATQLGLIKSKQYDFAPEFRDMTVQLYLLGVMWKFAETLGNGREARELAFTAMKTMFEQEGLRPKSAAKRVEFLRKMSKLEDNHDALAVIVGYQSVPGDNSLAEVFDHYVDDMQVSGAFWRLYDRGRKIMLYGGLLVAFVVIWFITLFMPGNSVIATLAAGLIAAALYVIPVFLIGIFMYRSRIKKSKAGNQPE